MPITDPAALEKSLSGRYPDAWIRHHFATFQSSYFEAFEPDDVARHLGRALALTDDRPVSVEAWPCPEAHGDWLVEVVGLDAFQFLSTVCCLLAIHGWSIVEAQAFTSDPSLVPRKPVPKRRLPAPGVPAPRPAATTCRDPRDPDRRPRVVDRFLVRPAGGPDHEPPDWCDFPQELAALTRLLRADRIDEVHKRLIPRFVAVLGRLRPVAAEFEAIDLTIDVRRETFATVVHVGARDSFGFLSLTAGALALCGIMIVQADVRTRSGRVDDTFWVTDRFGRRIEDEPRLRELRLSLILIEHYSSYLPHATNPEAALVHFSRFAAETMARPDWGTEYAALDRPEVLDALVRVLGESDFLWEDFLHVQAENLLPMVGDPVQWRRGRTPAELAADRDAAMAGAADLAAKAAALRRFRDRELFRAGARAILGRSGGPEGFAAELSDLAESLLQGAERIAREALEPNLPRRADGRPVPSALLALGKCGGRELGFGSDLELMFVYDDRAVTGTGGAGVAFDRFVSTLGQVLAVAPRGGTFDVDFRLRPHGRAGAPATGLSAFAAYYRAGGPAWGYERQALVKLRAVAGDEDLCREVETLRDLYVYGPEPFDLESCLRLRRLQVEQLVRPGRVNAKYSPGALVDVEYFVQALQIAHGFQDPSVRTPNTPRAIDALEAAGRLPAGHARVLRDGYQFFRSLIDGLRVVHGHAKDLTVPSESSEEFARLARRLGRATLRDELTRTLGRVGTLWTDAGRLLGTRD